MSGETKNYMSLEKSNGLVNIEQELKSDADKHGQK